MNLLTFREILDFSQKSFSKTQRNRTISRKVNSARITLWILRIKTRADRCNRTRSGETHRTRFSRNVANWFSASLITSRHRSDRQTLGDQTDRRKEERWQQLPRETSAVYRHRRSRFLSERHSNRVINITARSADLRATCREIDVCASVRVRACPMEQTGGEVWREKSFRSRFPGREETARVKTKIDRRNKRSGAKG